MNIKYLGVILITNPRWKGYVKKNIIELYLKCKRYYWLPRRNFKLTISNKILLVCDQILNKRGLIE